MIWFLLIWTHHIPFIFRLLRLTRPGKPIATAGEGSSCVIQALRIELFSFYEFLISQTSYYRFFLILCLTWLPMAEPVLLATCLIILFCQLPAIWIPGYWTASICTCHIFWLSAKLSSILCFCGHLKSFPLILLVLTSDLQLRISEGKYTKAFVIRIYHGFILFVENGEHDWENEASGNFDTDKT